MIYYYSCKYPEKHSQQITRNAIALKAIDLNQSRKEGSIDACCRSALPNIRKENDLDQIAYFCINIPEIVGTDPGPQKDSFQQVCCFRVLQPSQAFSSSNLFLIPGLICKDDAFLPCRDQLHSPD